MALDAVRETLEGLTDEVAELYREDNGRFVLDVAPAQGVALEDVSGLKSALEKERDNSRRAATQLKAFEGIDPEKAREALAKSTPPTPKPEPTPQAPDDNEALAKLRTTQEELKLTRDLACREAEKRAKDAAMLKHGGNTDLLGPILDGRVKAKWTDAGPVVQVLNDDGGARMTLASGETSDMTPDEFVSTLKTDDRYKPAFAEPPAQGSGARSSRANVSDGDANPFKTGNETAQGALIKSDPDKAKRLAQAAGHPFGSM